jgi:hypothetical protein
MFWKKKTEAKAPPPATPPPLPAKEPMKTGKGHPGTFDAPKNPLEESLIAFRERRLEATRFLEELLNSEIYVLPLHSDIVESSSEGGGLALSKTPTIFCMNYPEYAAIGLFTAPERAKPTCDLHPEFRFATAVQAGSFLLGLKGDFGIVLNPYWDVNIEWTNEQVRRILGMIRRD